MDRPAHVMLKITWDPYLAATVDGAAAPVLRVTPGFAAVPVPVGVHDVTVRYRPGPLRPVLFFAGSLLFAVWAAGAGVAGCGSGRGEVGGAGGDGWNPTGDAARRVCRGRRRPDRTGAAAVVSRPAHRWARRLVLPAAARRVRPSGSGWAHPSDLGARTSGRDTASPSSNSSRRWSTSWRLRSSPWERVSRMRCSWDWPRSACSALRACTEWRGSSARSRWGAVGAVAVVALRPVPGARLVRAQCIHRGGRGADGTDRCTRDHARRAPPDTGCWLFRRNGGRNPAARRTMGWRCCCTLRSSW